MKNINAVLVVRTCKLKLCILQFKVAPKSSQEYCSTVHAKEDGWEAPKIRSAPWVSLKQEQMVRSSTGTAGRGEQKKVSVRGGKPIELGLSLSGKIPTTEKNAARTRWPTATQIQKCIDENPSSNITPIPKNLGIGKTLYEPTIGKPITNDRGRVMHEAEKNDLQSSKKDETGGILPVGSTEHLLHSAMVSSPSLAILDSCSEHLFGLMQSVEETEDTRQLAAKVDRINAVCNATKNIRDIMKLKLDAMKLQHEVNKETGRYTKLRDQV